MEQRLLIDKFVRRKLASALVALLAVSGAQAVRGDERRDDRFVALRAEDAHGRPFDLERTRGQVVALTFASRYTREEADRVHAALLSHAAGDVLVVNVVDFMGIPGLFRGYARRKTAEHDGANVIHLVDESGQLRRLFGADPGHRVDILVIDRMGQLRGRFAGQTQLEEAVRLVDQLRTSTASN